MYAIYKITPEELTLSFLERLKAIFKNKKAIEIAVYEADETGYLLASEANRKNLLKAIKNVEKRRHIITPDQKQFR